ILVNDTGPDDSLAVALELVAQDKRIRAVDLSRRYGHYEAMLAGLSQAKGRFVLLIDSDLEEPPELLNELWNELQRDGECDLVVACQSSRRLRSLRDLGGAFYYRALRA